MNTSQQSLQAFNPKNLMRTNKIFNIIYVLIVTLFVLDVFTGFDIKNQGLKSFVYFGYIIGTPLIFTWNLLAFKTERKRIIWLMFPTIMLALGLFIGPMAILFQRGAWHTQTIKYKNGHLAFKTVEFQMQDMGSLGYNKRTVEVFYLTPLFIITSEVPQDIKNHVEWIKVDKEVNELGLKFP
jgi:hypothetical protein